MSTKSPSLCVLVCGGRDFTDQATFDRVMGELKPSIGSIVTNHAQKGADRMAKRWADENTVPVTVYRKDWLAHQHEAEAVRNQRMLDEGKPDMVVAFPSRDRGTADLLKRAEKAGVEIRRITETG